jgi:hypothetical protein
LQGSLDSPDDGSDVMGPLRFRRQTRSTRRSGSRHLLPHLLSIASVRSWRCDACEHHVWVLVGGFCGLASLHRFYGFNAFSPWFVDHRDWLSVVSHCVFGAVLAYSYVAINRRGSIVDEESPQAPLRFRRPVRSECHDVRLSSRVGRNSRQADPGCAPAPTTGAVAPGLSPASGRFRQGLCLALRSPSHLRHHALCAEVHLARRIAGPSPTLRERGCIGERSIWLRQPGARQDPLAQRSSLAASRAL